MAMEQGSKNIKVLGNGVIQVGTGHQVRAGSTEEAIKAAQDAYGKQIGSITYADGTSTLVNEYKANPKKEVPADQLREVGKLFVEYKRDSNGNKIMVDGKPILTAMGVKYSDGTKSYTGHNPNGGLDIEAHIEAYRRMSSAKMYNEAITDARTRADFDTDEQYNSFLTHQSVRIGQGMYTKITDKDGGGKLVAGNGAVVATGNEDEIRQAFRTQSNNYHMAHMSATQAAKPISSNEKQYIMQTKNLSTEEEFNAYVREQYRQRVNALEAIHSGWEQAASEQGLLEQKNYYRAELPSYGDDWIPTITQSTEPYSEWYTNTFSGENATITTDNTGLNKTGTDEIKLNDTNITGGTIGGDTSGSGSTNLGGTMTGGTTGPITGGNGITGGTTGSGGESGTSITGADQSTGLPTLDDLAGGMQGIGGGMTGQAGTAVQQPTIDYSQLQNYNPASGTFTYTGTPMDQLASGTFTMGQQPIGLNSGMTGTTSGMTGGMGATEVRTYRNAGGLTANITFVNGQPQTQIPQGFYPIGQQQAGTTGMTGTTNVDMSGTQVQMARGGVIYAAEGVDTGNVALETKASPTTLGQQSVPLQPPVAKDDPSTPAVDEGATIVDIMEYQATTPGLPTGGAYIPAGVTETQGQFMNTLTGQLDGDISTTTTQATTTMSTLPEQTNANLMTAAQVGPAVNTAVEATTAAQMNPDDTRAQVTAAQATESSVSSLEAATGNYIKMDNPTTREIMDGELISGSADATKAAKFTEAIQHAEATPSKQATVQGQLEGLMQQFEGGETPPWAAGAMRTAMQSLAARGLGASSMAGQAVIQAAMEASLPIAQADAATLAQFEFKNLSNRQERAMLAAQQRAQFMQQEFDQDFQSRVFNASKVSEIANMNFTAEQQIALENSRAANTMNMANLNNQQALVMAEAAALSQLDMANLNNVQQAAVQNAQNFLSIEMQNLSNKQQTELFKKQQAIQALFNDQAATNAAEQFNASSQNQVDQFFASLKADVSKFNANQANAQAQFNAGEANAMEKFEQQVNDARDQFNANNRLVIDQSNAQWRREIATADTAAVNRANEINAQAVLGMNQMAYNNLWQYYNDSMSWAWTSAENQQERATNLAIEQLRAKTTMEKEKITLDYTSAANFGAMIGKIMTTDLSGSFLGDAFKGLTDLLK